MRHIAREAKNIHHGGSLQKHEAQAKLRYRTTVSREEFVLVALSKAQAQESQSVWHSFADSRGSEKTSSFGLEHSGSCYPVSCQKASDQCVACIVHRCSARRLCQKFHIDGRRKSRTSKYRCQLISGAHGTAADTNESVKPTHH